MDRVPNARIRESCGVTNGIDERFDEGFLQFQFFGHVDRMENDRFGKKVYVAECTGSHSEGKPRKGWIDTVKKCLKERSLDVRQARKMVQDRSECRGHVRGNARGVARGMNP